MIVLPTSLSRTFWVRLDPDTDVLRGLERAVEEAGIQNGAILGGVGSLTSYHFHVVASTNLPPGNDFARGVGPFDIVNINGAILGGRVHSHITLTDTEKTLGGHLEEGCNVLTFAIILIAETEGVDLAQWDTVAALEA